MLKQSVSPKIMAKIQERVEAVQNQFEQQEFEASSGDVKLTITGDFKLKSVVSTSGKADISIVDLQEANRIAVDELEHQRSIHLLRIRNQINKDHRVDIKSLVPEVAAAVAYMDKRQSKAQSLAS